jgi:hypothetical protein
MATGLHCIVRVLRPARAAAVELVLVLLLLLLLLLPD